jgi:hypothetical protein
LVDGGDVHGDPYQRDATVNKNGRIKHWEEVVRFFIPNLCNEIMKECVFFSLIVWLTHFNT